jgi:hypothetical protein
VTALPSFEEAVGDLQRFLAFHRHPTAILWVFREDIWLPRSSRLIVFEQDTRLAEALVAERYAQAQVAGLGELTALGGTPTHSAVGACFPGPDAIQGWNSGLKLSIRDPFAKALVVRENALWRLLRARRNSAVALGRAQFIDPRLGWPSRQTGPPLAT